MLKYKLLRIFLVSLAILFGFSTTINAQNKKLSTIQLHSGSEVFGKIISTDSSAKVLIVQNDCGINVLKFSDIKNILPPSGRTSTLEKSKGYYNLSSLALLFGEGRDGFIPIPSLTMVHGYQFNNNVLLGIGLGYEYYEWSVMPLFIDAKYMMKREYASRFFSMKIGYGIPLQKRYSDYYSTMLENTYGGVLVAPEVGVKFPLGSKDALLVSLGYHHQQLSYEKVGYNWRLQDSYTKSRVYTYYNRISLRVAMMFR